MENIKLNHEKEKDLLTYGILGKMIGILDMYEFNELTGAMQRLKSLANEYDVRTTELENERDNNV